MVEAVLLGIAQDGGRPQPGCNKDCCIDVSSVDEAYPVALGLVEEDTFHLIDVSRFLARQLRFMNAQSIGHVFLTHAHFGHVDGLGLFGKETMNLRGIPLHLSASMLELLRSTPHWNVLLEQGVVVPHVFSHGKSIEVSSQLSLQPIVVPHRAELSDTHAFLVKSNSTTLLYLPDHDTWQETLGAHDLRSWLASYEVDIALIDGTFWSLDELSHRVQSEVPHPPVCETIDMLGQRQHGDPEIEFIHLNHTNPLYDTSGKEYSQVKQLGWDVGRQGKRYSLG
jgi:pyrroloquinoline quinone biosynthesis protein B